MTNGLDQLKQQRELRKTRTVPPPRNPARTTPVEAPAVQQETQLIEPKPEPVPAPPILPVLTTVEDLTKYSIYFDTSNDEFLEAVRVAGRHAKPRLDASRSAVARLAVARLAESLSPEEVLAELRLRSPKQERTGRKRL